MKLIKEIAEKIKVSNKSVVEAISVMYSNEKSKIPLKMIPNVCKDILKLGVSDIFILDIHDNWISTTLFTTVNDDSVICIRPNSGSICLYSLEYKEKKCRGYIDITTDPLIPSAVYGDISKYEIKYKGISKIFAGDSAKRDLEIYIRGFYRNVVYDANRNTLGRFINGNMILDSRNQIYTTDKRLYFCPDDEYKYIITDGYIHIYPERVISIEKSSNDIIEIGHTR
jgi:hypothetical protein